MAKFMIIVDCQKDFIDGSLGTPEAQAMIPRLIDKINHSSDDTYFIFTKDTHYDNYLEMLGDLYNKSINGILVSTGYVVSFSGYDNYSNIGSETKIVYTYKEDMENQDIKLSSNKSLKEPFTILLYLH